MARRSQRREPVNVHDAKTNLSKLLERVEQGEEVVIARSGEPVARLVPVREEFAITGIGSLRGRVATSPGFDQADDEITRLIDEGHQDDPLLQDPEEWEWPTEG